MEAVARGLLADMGLGEAYVGWTMVALVTAFWHDQVAAVPPSRRLFLLPHCLKHAEGCPADYDDFGLECKKCGACSIADFRTAAEDLGYSVLVAEGSPVVLKIIVSGYVDAIVGVACLNVLEKAIDKILLAGIPCMAVPLLSSDCRNTSVDESWVSEMIQTQHAAPRRANAQLLALDACRGRHVRARRTGTAGPAVARRRQSGGAQRRRVGGRRSDRRHRSHRLRLSGQGGQAFPAVHHAGRPRRAHRWSGHAGRAAPSTWRRCPMRCGAPPCRSRPFTRPRWYMMTSKTTTAIRYGDATLHRRWGVATAINVGDYLIGLGYRLVSREAVGTRAGYRSRHSRSPGRRAHEAGRRAGGRAAVAGRRRQTAARRSTPCESMRSKPHRHSTRRCIAGARLAGDAARYVEPLGQFARHLGVAFQISMTWTIGKPTIPTSWLPVATCWAGGPPCCGRWRSKRSTTPAAPSWKRWPLRRHAEPAKLERVRELYTSAGVFEKAQRLVDKYRERAEAVADEIEPDELRRLLYYLVDTVLDRPAADPPLVQLGGALPLSAESSAVRCMRKACAAGRNCPRPGH